MIGDGLANHFHGVHGHWFVPLQPVNLQLSKSLEASLHWLNQFLELGDVYW